MNNVPRVPQKNIRQQLFLSIDDKKCFIISKSAY